MNSVVTIPASTLNEWITKQEAILVDVREPAEHTAENIPFAKLIPLSEITQSKLSSFKDKKIVIHCKSGKRSEAACNKLLNENSNLDIYSLKGGFDGWVNAGYKTKKSGNFFLPLDRQVQLVIGIGVISGVMLGSLVNLYFLIIPGIFGVGLIFAAISGCCSLAILMSKMPWNKGSSTSSCSIKKII